MTTPPRSHSSSHNAETSAKKSAGKASYEIKPSFADDGAPRFAILRGEAFVVHEPTQEKAEATVKDLEARDEAAAEEQKARDARRDANKAAGIHAAEKRGEQVAPEMHRFAEQHDRAE